MSLLPGDISFEIWVKLYSAEINWSQCFPSKALHSLPGKPTQPKICWVINLNAQCDFWCIRVTKLLFWICFLLLFSCDSFNKVNTPAQVNILSFYILLYIAPCDWGAIVPPCWLGWSHTLAVGWLTSRQSTVINAIIRTDCSYLC